MPVCYTDFGSDTWNVTFPIDKFCKTDRHIIIGDNQFNETGIQLSLQAPGLNAEGKLDFGTLTPLKYDIMGPFAFIPFLECRHSVWSMKHSVCGTIRINAKEYCFQNDWGYWEGDCGRSFPKEYAWVQCCFPEGSFMLSVADIPMAGIHFTGVIGVILWERKEYRLATYLGARAVQITKKVIQIVQGDMMLEIFLFETDGHSLKAPANGEMMRTIHEKAVCRAFFRFRKKNHNIFAFDTEQASFEYEYLN